MFCMEAISFKVFPAVARLVGILAAKVLVLRVVWIVHIVLIIIHDLKLERTCVWISSILLTLHNSRNKPITSQLTVVTGVVILKALRVAWIIHIVLIIIHDVITAIHKCGCSAPHTECS